MSPRVVSEIERADAEAIRRLAAAGVATVHEAQGKAGLMQAHMRPIYAQASAAGSAVTVSLPPGDNLMIHAAMEVCRPGDLLVVAPTSPCTDGYFGELLAVSARARGVVGIVIEAGVRDVAALTAMAFPAWSRAISAQGTVKASPGSVNVPLTCAGVLVRPGDVVIGDQDGVVCVPRAQAAEVAAKAEVRTQREAATRSRLMAGELGLDIYQFRPLLKQLGVQYDGGHATQPGHGL